MHGVLLLLAIAEAWTWLVLPRGEVEASATVELGLATRQTLEPVSLAPDAWWGVTDRVTVGVITSAHALSRVEAGGGLCVRGAEHGCDRLYDNLALDGRALLADDGAVAVAGRARLVARSFDPAKPSLRLGALLRWRRGAVAVEADPHLQIGLAHRDAGNRDQLSLPLWLRVELGGRGAVWLHSGARGEWIGFGEKYETPFALGGAVRLGRYEVGGEAGFAALLGPQNQLADRSAYVYVATRVGR